MLSTSSPARRRNRARRSRILTAFVLGVVALLFAAAAPQSVAPSAQAQTRVALVAEFQEALDPYGRWVRHPRWGDVWIPDVDPEWQPYTVGQWVYTDEWGWYWESEEDFGWIVFHYGRWVIDPDLGWIWIPGETWGPAWVQWRHSPERVGWAPMAPDDVIYEYDDVPDYWVFVGARDFTAPRIAFVMLPRRERVVFIRQTVIVNRTVFIDRGPRIAVNPGIEPRIIAAGIGRPIRVAAVRPPVVRGTVGVQGAMFVQTDRRERQRIRTQISERQETIAPADRPQRLEPLARGERGRLGERPPRAAVEQARRPDEPARQQFQSPGRDRDSYDARTRTLRPGEDDGAKQRGEGLRDKDGQERQLQERARPDRGRPDSGPQPFGGEQARPDRSGPKEFEQGPGSPDRAMRQQERFQDRSGPKQFEQGPSAPDRAMRQERLPDRQQIERGQRPPQEFRGPQPDNGARERVLQDRAPSPRAGPPPGAAPRALSPSGPGGGGNERMQPQRAPRGGDEKAKDWRQQQPQ